MKLCECGCGKNAPISSCTSKAKGYIKGQPCRFIKGHSNSVRNGKTEKERFFNKVNKNTNSFCWEWLGHIDTHGYGQFWSKGKKIKAHRFSYNLFKGSIQNKFLVCHTCDNRKCLNPDHLWLGTHKDNSKDCVAKGRHPWKNQSPRFYKFTEDQINLIREQQLLGKSYTVLAAEFNTCISNIHYIVKRSSWKHLK